MRGKRMIAGGRKPVRDALYIAALPKLRASGKPGKVAIVAVIRKMPIILNARMRDHNATVPDC